MKRILILVVLFFPFIMIAQQHFEQTVRGVVLEKVTNEPLPGAAIVVLSDGKEFGTITNENGEFGFSGVPVGRCHITVSMLGFTSYISNNILVYSGKETVLEIALEENVYALEAITVTAKVDKELPLNKMATASTRMLSSEEANRYAGSWGDPARMVASFAGVMAANDTRNDIIIRGNSPVGLLWRLDGFDIPNPNHFGAMGGTGGPVGMLNSKQLANSDFYTGAFPAEFGNATSGVFDLRLRNGNNQRREYLVSAGINGFELGAEGPVSKETNASYMINGRYSFLNILKKLGAEFYESAVPEYRDICAKVNIPLKDGNLSWIALAGASQIHTEPDFSDTSDWGEGERVKDMRYQNHQFFTGLNYTHRFNYSTRLENRLSWQFFRQNIVIDEIVYPTMDVLSDTYLGKDREGRIAFVSTLNHRVNTKNLIRSGTGVDIYLTKTYHEFEGDVLNNYRGITSLLKAFVQWQHRFNNIFSLTSGLYSQLYTLNGDFSLEPRIGFKWEASSVASFSLGSGLHGQLQPRQVYLHEKEGIVKNRDLEMSKSWQTTLGYQQKLGVGIHLKTEVYYQSLFNIPVIPEIPQESILNLGDDYYNSFEHTFVNEGTGRNYGIEITLEKFFERHYYFLLTASLFDSKYKAFDKKERYTKFAGHYAFNVLFGYEWKAGKKSLLSLNTKIAYVGGKRYVPQIVTVSSEYPFGYIYEQAYINKLPDYFRIDLNVNVKSNYKRFSLEWFVEQNNLTNRKNIWQKYFNAYRNKDEYIYQYGFMTVGGVRIYF